MYEVLETLTDVSYLREYKIAWYAGNIEISVLVATTSVWIVSLAISRKVPTLCDNKSTAIFHLIISSKLTAARRDSFSWVGKNPRNAGMCRWGKRVSEPGDKKRVKVREEERVRKRERKEDWQTGFEIGKTVREVAWIYGRHKSKLLARAYHDFRKPLRTSASPGGSRHPALPDRIGKDDSPPSIDEIDDRHAWNVV